MSEMLLKNGRIISSITVAIPSEMKIAARERGLNFSQLLKNAVQIELNTKKE